MKAWLLEHGYRATTVEQTERTVARARRHWAQTRQLLESPELVYDLRRYLAFVVARGGPQDDFEVALARKHKPAKPFVRSRKRRVKLAKSFVQDDWGKLRWALQRDQSPEGAAIGVLMATSLRAGDLLRLSKSRLLEGLKTGVVVVEIKGGEDRPAAVGGAQEAWAKLERLWRFAGLRGELVADFVCPGCENSRTNNNGAYVRLKRHLAQLGKELGLEGRVHLHRIRRTVATKALEQTKDIHAVQQLLGHRSMNTTLSYVDEYRRGAIEDLQRKLNEPS